ncbi:MAG TPA: hypothetical protein ENI96_08750 [Sedimenticola thiotaurini]|uniref:Uncharacterized protein n=1 Tax=Sedimenticola thiotaurini TaxID=1543721 RepID=A0A831RKQ0_9GAMM|nr:hypothetical protein [Sedimenticola thiotaurini]
MELHRTAAGRAWPLSAWILFPLLLIAALPVRAEGLEGYTLHGQLGAYTHYSSSDDHKGPPVLVNLELNSPQDWLFGLSLFNNSFGQFSQYLYAGKKWRLPKIQKYLQVKLTAGVVHGYDDEFEDKIPFNKDGWGVGVIPSVGFKKDRWAVDLVALGTAGLLLAVGYDIWEW